jgi:molybdopterin molybdotransferase
VPLAEAVGRVLADCPPSDRDLPPFDRSTMDGYAVRAGDLACGNRLRCVGNLAAGAVSSRPVGPGEALRIMTGAPLPEGADSVVMVEETREEGDHVLIEAEVTRGQNIHGRGSDLRRGERPLTPGSRLTPAHVPVLATLGCTEVAVFRRPVVAILTSGDELVEPGEVPGPGRIRDSNRSTLAAQVRSAGGVPRPLPIVRDDVTLLEGAVQQGLDADVLLLTGGSSVGDRDYSEEVIARTGAHRWFQKVAIKPGKPVLYFTRGATQIFCLPGNPVSAFVTFELLVRPALELLQGNPLAWPVPLLLPLAAALRAPRARELFQVSEIVAADSGGWGLRPVRWHGSGDLVSVARANALCRLGLDESRAAGDLARAYPLRHLAENLPRRREPCP